MTLERKKMKVPFHESNRLLFIEKRYGPVGIANSYARVFVLYFFIIAFVGCALIGTSYLLYQKGVRDGARQALDTRNPSDALELACAGLWVGKQNQKFWDRKY